MKNAFEASGSSPGETHDISPNGAPRNTGRGLEDVKRRIREAFAEIRCDVPAPAPPQMEPEVDVVYTPELEEKFHQKVKRLETSCLIKSSPRPRYREVYVIRPTTRTADQLIEEAMRMLNGRGDRRK
jgi:hypothetical protein